MSSEDSRARYLSAASTFSGQQYKGSHSERDYETPNYTTPNYSTRPAGASSSALNGQGVSRSDGISSRTELTFQHTLNVADRVLDSTPERVADRVPGSLDQQAVLNSYQVDRGQGRYSSSPSPQVPNPYKHLHTISRHPYEDSSGLGSTGVLPSQLAAQMAANSVPRNSPNDTARPEETFIGRSDYDQKEFSVKAEKGQQIVTGDRLDAGLMKNEIHIPHSIATLSERDLQTLQENRSKRAIASDYLSTRENTAPAWNRDHHGLSGSGSRVLADTHGLSGSGSRVLADTHGLSGSGSRVLADTHGLPGSGSRALADTSPIVTSDRVGHLPSGNMTGSNSYPWSLSPAQERPEPFNIAKESAYSRPLDALMEREQLSDNHVGLSLTSPSFPPTFEDPSMSGTFHDFRGDRKSGLLWRKPERGGTLKPERCRCTLQDGIFEVQMLSTVDLGLDEAFDLTQWSLDERFSFREQITLVDNSRNRLMRFDADSVDIAEEWRIVLRNSSPGQYQHVSKSQRVNMMVSAAKKNLKGNVMSAWKNNIFVKARRLETKVLRRLIYVVWSEWRRYLADKKQRRLMAMSPELEAMELERSLGISRLYLAHWRVVTSRCPTGIVTKDYHPARQPTSMDEVQFQLKASQMVAMTMPPEQGWGYGMRLPASRWEAVKTNLWQEWFPLESVEVLNDGKHGYWGRAGPMSITVIGARNLPPNEFKKRVDSYCTVHVHAGRKTTDLRRNTLNPDWVQSFPFDATEDDDVTVMVWEWDRLKKDELIGYINVPSQQLLHDCEAARAGSDPTVTPLGEGASDVANLFKGGRGYKLFNADGEVLVGSDHEESVLLLDCLPMRWEFPKRELPPDEPKLPAKAIEPYVKEQKRSADAEQKELKAAPDPQKEAEKKGQEKVIVPKLLPKPEPVIETKAEPEAPKPLQDLSAMKVDAVAPRGTSETLPAARETSTSVPAVETLDIMERKASLVSEPQVLYPPATTPRGTNPAPTLPAQATPPQPAAQPQRPPQTFASPFAPPMPLHSAPHAHPTRSPGLPPPVPVPQNLFPKKFRIILVGAIGLPKRWIGHYDHSVIVQCRNASSGSVAEQRTKKVQGQNVTWEEYFDFQVEDHMSTLWLQIPQVGEVLFSADELQTYADQCMQPQPPLQWMGATQGSGSHKLFQTMTQRYPTAFPCPIQKANTRNTLSFKNANPVLLCHIGRLDPPAPPAPPPQFQSPPPGFPQQSTPPQPHQPHQAPQQTQTPQLQQPPQVRAPPPPEQVTDVSVQDLAAMLPTPKAPTPQPAALPAQPVPAPQPAAVTKSPPPPAASAEISQAAPVTKTEDSGRKVAALALSFMEGNSATASQSMTPRSRTNSISSPRGAKPRGTKSDTLTISEAPGPKGFTMAASASHAAPPTVEGSRVGSAQDLDDAFNELMTSPRSPRYPTKDFTINYPVTLEVTVVGARYLPFASGPKSNSFCFLQVGESKFHTRSWSDSIEPQWQETFTIEMLDSEDLVISMIQSSDSLSGQFVGVVRLAPERIIRGYVLPRDKQGPKRGGSRDMGKGLAITDEISLHKLIGHDGRAAVDDSQRFSELALRFRLVGGGKTGSKSDAADTDKAAAVTISAVPGKDVQLMAPRDIELNGLSPTRLYLRLAGGANLPETAGLGHCNSYCKVRVGENRYQTQVCLNSLDPEWHEDFDVVVNRGDEITITVLDWDFLKMDRVIGVVKVSADQLLQDSAEAKARAKHEQGKNASARDVVLKDSSSASLNNISSSSAFKNMSISSGWKYGSTASVASAAPAAKIPIRRRPASVYNSSMVAFNGEMESRKSGYINFKVFSTTGSELKSRAGLQTCIALKCQTTPFMDMDMDEAYPAAPDVTAVVETSTLAIENGLERVVDIPSAMGGNNVKIEVVVLAARNLPTKRPDTPPSCNSYCILQLGSQTKRTAVKNNSANPVFCEELHFTAPRDVPDLFVSVMSRDKHNDEPLGVVQVPVVAMKDSARMAEMEEALSGLSFLRPRDEAAPVETALATSPILHPMPSDCADVPDSLFHRRYPGMKQYDLLGSNGSLVVDNKGRKTALLLRCLVVDSNAKNEPTGVVSSKENPVALSMKFSGDIQKSVMEDDAQLSRWKKQLRNDLADSLGASKQRFGVVSVEVTDGIIANLVVLPLWMLPGLNEVEPKTARAMTMELASQVHDPSSKLRSAAPYLSHNVEILMEDPTMNEEDQHDEASSDDVASSIHSVEHGDDHDATISSPARTAARSQPLASRTPPSWIQKEVVASPPKPDPPAAPSPPSPPRPTVPHVIDYKAVGADGKHVNASPVTAESRPAPASPPFHTDTRRRSVSPEGSYERPSITARTEEAGTAFKAWMQAMGSDEIDGPPPYEAPRSIRTDGPPLYEAPRTSRTDSGRRERKQNAKRWFEDRQFRKIQAIVRGWLAVAKQSHWSRSRGYGAEQEGEYARVSPSTKHVQSRSYGDNSHNLSTSSTGHQTMVDVPVPISETLRWTSPPIQIQASHVGDRYAEEEPETDITKWAMIKCMGCGSYKRRDRVGSSGRCKKCERQRTSTSTHTTTHTTLTEDGDVYREGIC